MKIRPHPLLTYSTCRAYAAVALTSTVLNAVLLAGFSAKATTYDWTSANSGGYTNQADWSPTGLPGIADTAIIGNATQPNGSIVYTNLPPDPASTNRLSLLEMGAAAGTSSFNMMGGVLLITNSSGTALSQGAVSGAVSTFTQGGGTLVVAKPSTANLYFQDAFLPGDAGGANGSFTINNGVLDILCGCEIGTAGSGTFSINGGTVIDNGWLGVRGIGTSSDSGVFNMTGGTLYVLRNTEIESQAYRPLCLGQGSTGSSTANISGGTAYLESITFANYAVNETLNMSGGTLYIGIYGVQSRGAVAGGSQNINISGGTFHTADMQIISTTANCGNTNTILGDGTNWLWGPALPVNLTNGTFTVNGQSGPGYVTFAPEINRTITLSNNWFGVGGMTMSGPGTLALAGNNSFSGPLTMNGGTLALSGASTNSGGIALNSGTLAVSAAEDDSGGLTVSGGSVSILNGGSLVDDSINFPSGTSLVFDNSNAVTFTNIIAGAGDVLAAGSGSVNLDGANTYTGPTILDGGSSVILGPNASISDSPLIYLTPSSSTLLDVSALGAFALGSGQTLEGAGTINGNVTANAGSIIAPGTNATTYGTIVFANNLTLNGNTNDMKLSDNSNVGVDNDLISVQQNLTLTGVSTFYISPLAELNSSSPYTLIEADGGITGGAQNVQLTNSLNPRYTVSPSIGTDINGRPALLLNVSGSTAPLEWQGYLTRNWDLVTSNWYNMSTSVHDHFFNSDNPTFDDTASVTAVVVTNNVTVSSMNMSNVVNSYTFSGGGVITGPLNMEGNGNGTGGTTVLATSNAPAFTTIDASAGTLVFDLPGVANYTVAASISDNYGLGDGTIIFGGTNTATLTGNNVPAPVILGSYNPDFDGTIMVTNGVLQYTNVDSLGVDYSVNSSPSFSPLIVTNNGTLNFNGVAAGPANFAPYGGEKWIHISGNGYNGQGALTDKPGSQNSEPNGTFCYLYLDGNATIGSPFNTRYDQHFLSGNAQQIEGNGYNLTYIGQGYVTIYGQNDEDTHFGNIDVASTVPGRLIFQNGPLALGITTDYLTVESNSCVTFYDVTNNLDPTHGGIDKVLWLKGSATLDSGGATPGGNTNNYVGPVFLTGTNWIGTRVGLYLWNGIMDSNGPGGFVLGNTAVGSAGGPLWLEGTNTYSGPTIVSNQTLFVGANSSLGFSTYVQVNSGAALNLSATPDYNFGTTQTNQIMVGNGTVVGPATGSLNFNAGGTLAVGLPNAAGQINTNASFTLTINNSVVFNSGSTNFVVANKANPNPGAVPVDKLGGLTSLTLGGTLVVTNFGAHFVAGDSLALFSATTIATNSTFNIVPATPGPGLAWNFSTFLTAGTLQVSSSTTVNLNPTNITARVSGGQLSLSWPADHTGWELEVQTNSVTAGIGKNWVPYPSSTNMNTITIPINLSNGTVFYRLVYPPQ
ncbi:MAG TPA: autotransporter-associated beta strand repeat-containing protein [Candidatus Sulfotelmatobacter sp.]|nr:autotransporter-associated beta strand repeat-containing protein [Candidatus Sulfotelmatobacter sp.]